MHCWPRPRTTFKRSFRCSREPWGSACMMAGRTQRPRHQAAIRICANFPRGCRSATRVMWPRSSSSVGHNHARRRVAAICACVRSPSPSDAIFSPRLWTPSIVAGLGRNASNSNGAPTHWNAAPWGKAPIGGAFLPWGPGKAVISFVCGRRLLVFPSPLPTPIATWVRWQNRPFHWIAC